MTRTVKVHVGFRDIWLTKKLDGQKCMLNQPIRKATGASDVNVGTNYVLIQGIHVSLPPLAHKKRFDYDNNKSRVWPFSFDLEITDRVEKAIFDASV